MQKLIVIVGPTAVGKTALSLKLAEAVDGEIISGDSMQIYRGLDVGTAKATAEEQSVAPHHMIDITDPSESYSAAKFVEMAQAAIAEVASRGKVPILVGGTGFYVQALLGDRPLAKLDIADDPAFEAHWDAVVAEVGEAPLRDALREVDPISAERILPGQIRRLKRALHVSLTMGKPFSALEPEAKRQYDAFIIGLNTDRAVLYDRINQRVEAMLEAGVLEEARQVQQLPDTATAKMAIGYKELFPYLDGEESQEAGVARLQQASRRYAKRQLTWFNNQFTDIHWYDLVLQPEVLPDLVATVSDFVSE